MSVEAAQKSPDSPEAQKSPPQPRVGHQHMEGANLRKQNKETQGKQHIERESTQGQQTIERAHTGKQHTRPPA